MTCHHKGWGMLYLIKWKGFDNTPDVMSWELPKHLANASDVVKSFHQAYPDKPAPKFLMRGHFFIFFLHCHTLIIHFVHIFFRVLVFFFTSYPNSIDKPDSPSSTNLAFSLMVFSTSNSQVDTSLI